MAYFRCGTGGIPSSLTTDMNAVLNKKFGTSSQDYPYTDWAKDINLMGLLPEKIASGAIASFTDGADDVPVKEAVFGITATQAGTGDPTPSNVRAISGYTGMNVSKTGKNLLDINSVVQGGLDENTGAETTSSTVKRSGWIKVKANTTYILSNITNVRPYYYKAGQTSEFISRDSVTSSTFTTPASCVWLRLQAANSSWSGANIQLEEGSTATTYEAYKGTVIPVTFGSLNLLGAQPFGEAFMACNGYSLDTTNKTVKFKRSGDLYNLPTFKANTQYTIIITCTAAAQNNSLRFIYDDTTYTRCTIPQTSEKTTYVFTSTSGKTISKLRVAWDDAGEVTAYYDECGIFEGVVTADNFVPYIPDVVYGGSLNLTTGVLTVNKQIVVCDGSDDEGWTLLADSTYKYYAPVIAPNTNEIAETSNYMANKYIFRGMGGTTSSTVTDDKSVYMQASYGRVWIYDSEITSVANLKTSLLSQPLQVVYPLATPQTYQLTPHQMNTLLENNNIWADTGDASVTYRADISGGIREYLFKMDGTVSSFWANQWAERQRYMFNIGKWAFNQSKDIYIDVEFNGLPSSELNIVNFYVSDNRVFKVRTSNGAAQCKVQFGGGDVISWTAFDETKTLSFRLLRNYKIQIYNGTTLVASYDAPDSGSYRSIWNNTDGSLFCYGSTLAEYNIKSINMYAK